MLRALSDIFQKHHTNNQVAFTYDTKLYTGHLLP